MKNAVWILLTIATGLTIGNRTVSAQSPNRAELAARLRLSGVLLNPAVGEQLDDADPYAIASAVATREGLVWTKPIDSTQRFETRLGSKEFHVERDTGNLSIFDDRGYAATFSTSLDDAALTRVASSFLKAAGIADQNNVSKLRHTGASEKDDVREGKNPASTVRRVATKVFFFRRIGTLPVLGDRLVVSFGLDGSVRKVVGSWHPLDLTKGRTSFTATPADFRERVLDALSDHFASGNFRMTAKSPIRVTTAFVIREHAPGKFTADLRAVAAYDVVAPGNSSKETQYVLEL